MVIDFYNLNGGGGSAQYAESAGTSNSTKLLEGIQGFPQNPEAGDVVAVVDSGAKRGGAKAPVATVGIYQYDGSDWVSGGAGAQGPQGPQGETGPQGPQGPQGADGIDQNPTSLSPVSEFPESPETGEVVALNSQVNVGYWDSTDPSQGGFYELTDVDNEEKADKVVLVEYINDYEQKYLGIYWDDAWYFTYGADENLENGTAMSVEDACNESDITIQAQSSDDMTCTWSAHYDQEDKLTGYEFNINPSGNPITFVTNWGEIGLYQYDGSDWVQAEGPQGPEGAQGAQGPQGPRGSTGPRGPQGENGINQDPYILKQSETEPELEDGDVFAMKTGDHTYQAIVEITHVVGDIQDGNLGAYYISFDGGSANLSISVDNLMSSDVGDVYFTDADSNTTQLLGEGAVVFTDLDADYVHIGDLVNGPVYAFYDGGEGNLYLRLSEEDWDDAWSIDNPIDPWYDTEAFFNDVCDRHEIVLNEHNAVFVKTSQNDSIVTLSVDDESQIEEGTATDPVSVVTNNNYNKNILLYFTSKDNNLEVCSLEDYGDYYQLIYETANDEWVLYDTDGETQLLTAGAGQGEQSYYFSGNGFNVYIDYNGNYVSLTTDNDKAWEKWNLYSESVDTNRELAFKDEVPVFDDELKSIDGYDSGITQYLLNDGGDLTWDELPQIPWADNNGGIEGAAMVVVNNGDEYYWDVSDAPVVTSYEVSTGLDPIASVVRIYQSDYDDLVSNNTVDENILYIIVADPIVP